MSFDYSGFSILHAEDDPTDARIMKILLEKINYNGEYHRLSLGYEVTERLNDTSIPLPGLLMLDINLPGMGGKEILKALRGNERTVAVPILMMTGSSSLRDLRECIQLGANGYIKKMHDVDDYQNICRHFIESWARLAPQDFF